METRDALEALDEACLNREPGELEPLRRRSRNELKLLMLPGLRSLSKKDRWWPSSAKVARVGDSVERGASAR